MRQRHSEIRAQSDQTRANLRRLGMRLNFCMHTKCIVLDHMVGFVDF